mmetsp:Transcript_5816/g.17916  ORF Transcript_5816/g.17916 Transcript_5816/m.17916 type:complete len:408 (+) Transcript_5816:88-1311(+)
MVLGPRDIGLDSQYIHSLSGTHDCPQTAFKDLIANSITARATEVNVDFWTGKQQLGALLLYDNGTGPVNDEGVVDLESFLGLLFNLGASTARQDSGAVGQFGSGAITGALGVANNVVIATRSKACFFAALLSADMCKDNPGERRLKLPYLVYSFSDKRWEEGESGTFEAFKTYSVFKEIGDKANEDLLLLCKRVLPSAKQGGLLHVMSGVKETIDYTSTTDIEMSCMMKHAFDRSLSRFLAYSFYGCHNNVKILVKGKGVSWLDNKGFFRNTQLKFKKTFRYQAQGAEHMYTPVAATITIGFAHLERMGTKHNTDQFPFGMCISYAGMMCTMFEPMRRQRAGERSNDSATDKVLNYHIGMIAHVELKLADEKMLSDYNLLVNLRKDGFNENKAYRKLVDAVQVKADL